MTRQQIQTFLAVHPEMKHRKFIPQIVEMLTGVSNEKQIEVKVALRRLQEEIENDSKGEEMEKDWRAERGMKSLTEFAEEAGKKIVMINGVRYAVK